MVAHLAYKWLIFGLLASLASCSNNAYEDFGEDHPAEKAARYLEDNKTEKAQALILNHFGDTVKDYVLSATSYDSTFSLSLYNLTNAEKDYSILLSLLASSYAQEGGIDSLEIAIELAANGGGVSDVTDLFPVMPDATSSNINNLSLAIAIMNAIPSEELSNGDHFKMGMFLTASFTLSLKQLDLDEDGSISPIEADQLTDEQAVTILQTLVSADESINNFSGSENSGGVDGLISSIESAEGDSDRDKLIDFISTN